ncbi:MAG: hypothetical protein JSR66_00080 [Proteobacteria bacterium]|nr:hypothetical protein [Pseudomonadota bacterium]
MRITHDMSQKYTVQTQISTRRPRKGDRVKLRDCSLIARGIIVDEITEDYVRVQWDDLPAPATYRRSGLERDADTVACATVAESP